VQDAAFESLTGCVANAAYSPHPGTTVHARALDGRLIAGARSDDNGIYTLQVPTRSRVRIETGASGEEGFEVTVGQSRLLFAGCLQDSAA
jgi:hypothetical protein